MAMSDSSSKASVDISDDGETWTADGNDKSDRMASNHDG